MRFPAGFLWGASTSAFQVEGSTTADGRGRSIWDTFAETPGNVLDGDTGEPGGDHYNRYPEDVAIMRELGLGAYRFSIAWPRVLPEGGGQVNQAGLDFYDRLVDALLEAGIDPWPTLYHWDLPQALEDAGGWPARDTAYRFADFAEVMRDALGDRVSTWTTVNEPWCAAFLGYADGAHAPGRREPAAALAAAHHLMLGHGLAAAALREGQGGTGQARRVGLVLNPTTLRPNSTDPADITAVRRADGVRNRIFHGPLFQGAYPQDVLDDLAPVSDFAFVKDGDLSIISAPLDLVGVNFYTPHWIAASDRGIDPADIASGGDSSAYVGCEDLTFVWHGLPRTGIGWEVDPSGLYDVLTRLAGDAQGVPIYIIENGAAYPDQVDEDDAVHDPDRVAYLDGHLRAVREAMKAGAPLAGYFAWSLLDNFEWAWGYSQRFGLVHVDYETQRRRIKDSGRWYAQVARSGELPG
ncbi:GH1 family beta-glucosidase [Nocardiopsis mangrovi]|uniref:Beta-glucosidase n=1 Tax=Nocardiopsis mangrovi TaxID=1179818 RepID=A0ABV9DW29_9ACTN